jgi:hypothetical protein
VILQMESANKVSTRVPGSRDDAPLTYSASIA